MRGLLGAQGGECTAAKPMTMRAEARSVLAAWGLRVRGRLPLCVSSSKYKFCVVVFGGLDVAVVVAGFTVEASVWKSLVGAHAELAVEEYCWEFTKPYTVGMRGRMMDLGGNYVMDFRLFPADYRCDVESLWVRGSIGELVRVSKRFRKGDQVRVEVRDKEFWVGAFKVGDVIPYEEVEKIPPEPKPRRDATLGLVVEDFRRMVKKAEAEKVRDYIARAAYENVGFRVKDREATIMFFNEQVSRVDVRGYEPWCYSIEGEGESVYSLELFSKLLHLGFAKTMELFFEDEGILTVRYRGDDIEVRFWLAPRVPIDRFLKLLERPAPKRVQLWVVHEEEVKKFEGAVKSVNDVSPMDEVHVAMTEDLWLYWDAGRNFKGYLKASRTYFWEFRLPPARFSAVFSISHLSRFLADVEELTCFVEGEPFEALVLVGKGAKVTPKEIRSTELKMGVIDVPKVEGVSIFAGRSGILESVLADAEDAGDLFLVFVSTPFEIVAFGRDAVYYRASLPVDAMKHIEENYIPIREGHFRMLRNFFGRFPDALVTVGRSEPLRFDIYLALDLDYWIELRAMRGQVAEEVDEAVKAYKEEFEKPPPAPLEYVKVRFLTDVPQIVGADLKVYGPFRTGVVVELPKPNAEAFVERGVAAYEEVPPPPKLTKEEVWKMYDEELEMWVKQQIELHTPGFRGRLYYDVGEEWEEPTIALFTSEGVMEKFKDEIAVDRETVYKTYEEAWEKKPELGKRYLGRLSDRQHGFAADLVKRYEEHLFEEAKEKAKAPPPPPPKPEIVTLMKEAIKALEEL